MLCSLYINTKINQKKSSLSFYRIELSSYIFRCREQCEAGHEDLRQRDEQDTLGGLGGWQERGWYRYGLILGKAKISISLGPRP